jgi:hypothetical protein
MTAGRLARDVAIAELGVPLRAMRYVRNGLRAQPPAGAISYDGGGNTPLLLGAMAVLALPEMAAIDLALWHAAAWRIASDIVHVYAILWCLGLAEAFRTLGHLVDERTATFRTLFLRSVVLLREDIDGVAIVQAPRRLPPGAVRLGFAKRDRIVRIALRRPAVVESWLGLPREAEVLLIGADDVDNLALTLRQR